MDISINPVELERGRVTALAQACLDSVPTPLSTLRCPYNPGGPQDYFSEGDYWWPNPDDPGGAYIRRDGETNPGNFFGHRKLVIRLSEQVGALAAAYKLTHDPRYAAGAAAHLHAWFVDARTRMNPHLRYAQAIRGVCTGRGTGLIDTLHLVEVALSVETLRAALPEYAAIRAWFAQYLEWFTTHPYGQDERDAKNNHATCWVLQAAAFARLTGNDAVLADCRRRTRQILLPDQMAPDGSFPRELARTKPYGYSIFNLEVMSAICQLLSGGEQDLWRFELPDGRGLRRGMEFLYPYLEDKSRWRWARDVMHWEEWPVRQASLLFCGLAYAEPRYLDLWRRLNPAPTGEEVIRNLPVKQPVLWMN